MTVTDAHGATVRAITGTGRAGLNRVSWDLQMEPPAADNACEAPAVGGFGGAPQGPLVMPGVYTITVNLAGRALKGELRVDADPRVSFPDADRRAWPPPRRARRPARSETARPSRPTPACGSPSCRPTSTRRYAVSSLSRAIEGYSGLPTADQRRQIDWVFDDASKTMDAR